jgi:subtilisin-like proprotein convertase family protein
LFRFFHKNCRFFEIFLNLRTGGSFDFNKLEIFQNLRTVTWGFRQIGNWKLEIFKEFVFVKEGIESSRIFHLSK